MENTKALKKLIDTFVKDTKEIADMRTYKDIDAAEKQGVQQVQKIGILALQINRDLYNVVMKARKDTANGVPVAAKKKRK